MTILVTGGAGFIGGNFVLDWLAQSDETIVNLDKLTYAGNGETLASLRHDSRHQFIHGDIADRVCVDQLLVKHQPRAIIWNDPQIKVDWPMKGQGIVVSNNSLQAGTFAQADLFDA
jgi:dTDP-glucose 4,6-dehydratase